MKVFVDVLHFDQILTVNSIWAHGAGLLGLQQTEKKFNNYNNINKSMKVDALRLKCKWNSLLPGESNSFYIRLDL